MPQFYAGLQESAGQILPLTYVIAALKVRRIVCLLLLCSSGFSALAMPVVRALVHLFRLRES